MKQRILSILPETSGNETNRDNLENHPLFKRGIPTDKGDLNRRKSIDLVDFNQSAEAQFCELICYLLGDGELKPKEAVQEASFELNISPKTAQRYLHKYTARRAPFRIDDDGKIQCKIHKH